MAIIPYSEDLIQERLRFENPWWATGKVEDFYKNMQRRLYYDLFYPLIVEPTVRRAVVMMGPRRIGKTVLMYQAVQGLMDAGVDPFKIAFVSIEAPIYSGISLEQLFTYIRKCTGNVAPNGWYIFFDEIQYLKDWEIHLKSLVDSFPHTRFVVSGSAAAALKLKSMESGAGRFTDFQLPPLTFIEYIQLKGLHRLLYESASRQSEGGGLGVAFSAHHITELNTHFLDYINYGGYPEVIFSEQIQHNPGRYIRSDIVDKVLLRDLPMLYGITDVQELNSLFSALAYNTGGEIGLEELSKNSGVKKDSIKRYLDYLGAAFLIKVVNKVSDKPKTFQRITGFKVYLTNPSLRSALFTPLQPTDPFVGNLVETAIFAQWFNQSGFTPYYARWQKGEVDLVSIDRGTLHPKWAVEIKWSNRFWEKPEELKSLLFFLKENKLASAVVTTIDKAGVKIIDGIELIFVPAALYAYGIGCHVLGKGQEQV